MIAFTLSSLVVGTLFILLFALQRRVRIYRFDLARKEFFARYSRLSAAERVRVLARAEGRGEDSSFEPSLDTAEARLDELFRMRWQAMREAREFDFTRLGGDLGRLLRT